ncbi:hypothetical protein SEA_ZOOMAN_228 [Microbacterium phage Zooman]|nr:hypothetical protein SEA_ZOOMAN_228 [Microbacterium phage Zooman]
MTKKFDPEEGFVASNGFVIKPDPANIDTMWIDNVYLGPEHVAALFELIDTLYRENAPK